MVTHAGVETFGRCLPRKPGKFCTLINSEQIAEAFKSEYVRLRDGIPQLHPDEIFGRIEAWAGGMANTTPAHKAAVLAVLAYLFDKCEIFEDAQAMGAA